MKNDSIVVPNLLYELTEVRPSEISGLGLFAKTRILKGTIWWRAGEGDALLITREQYESLVRSEQTPNIAAFLETLSIYGYYEEALESLVMCLDNARYCNHSFEPNSGPTPTNEPLCSMALRDIEAGEEILEDYSEYNKCPWLDMCESFMEEMLSNA